MPLLKKKSHKLLEPAKDLEPHELVYQVRLTKEIFRDYQYPSSIAVVIYGLERRDYFLTYVLNICCFILEQLLFRLSFNGMVVHACQCTCRVRTICLLNIK